MIFDILHKEAIQIGLDPKDKNELFEIMLTLASKTGKVKDFDQVLKEIKVREAIMSTGIGGGIALPHAKSKAIDDCTASMVVLRKPFDYGALDSMPVNIVFMILSNYEAISNHLKILSQISKLIISSDFKQKLSIINSENEAYNLILNYK